MAVQGQPARLFMPVSQILLPFQKAGLVQETLSILTMEDYRIIHIPGILAMEPFHHWPTHIMYTRIQELFISI